MSASCNAFAVQRFGVSEAWHCLYFSPVLINSARHDTSLVLCICMHLCMCIYTFPAVCDENSLEKTTLDYIVLDSEWPRRESDYHSKWSLIDALRVMCIHDSNETLFFLTLTACVLLPDFLYSCRCFFLPSIFVDGLFLPLFFLLYFSYVDL